MLVGTKMRSHTNVMQPFSFLNFLTNPLHFSFVFRSFLPYCTLVGLTWHTQPLGSKWYWLSMGRRTTTNTHRCGKSTNLHHGCQWAVQSQQTKQIFVMLSYCNCEDQQAYASNMSDIMKYVFNLVLGINAKKIIENHDIIREEIWKRKWIDQAIKTNQKQNLVQIIGESIWLCTGMIVSCFTCVM